MPQVAFEPTISAGERPKTYALDRAATGTGDECLLRQNLLLCDLTLALVCVESLCREFTVKC